MVNVVVNISTNLGKKIPSLSVTVNTEFLSSCIMRLRWIISEQTLQLSSFSHWQNVLCSFGCALCGSLCSERELLSAVGGDSVWLDPPAKRKSVCFSLASEVTPVNSSASSTVFRRNKSSSVNTFQLAVSWVHSRPHGSACRGHNSVVL